MRKFKDFLLEEKDGSRELNADGNYKKPWFTDPRGIRKY